MVATLLESFRKRLGFSLAAWDNNGTYQFCVGLSN